MESLPSVEKSERERERERELADSSEVMYVVDRVGFHEALVLASTKFSQQRSVSTRSITSRSPERESVSWFCNLRVDRV